MTRGEAASCGQLQAPRDAFDLAWLRTKSRPVVERARGELRVVDLFSGCGAMTLGTVEAGRAVGIRVLPVLGVDINEAALAAYQVNFPEARTISSSVTSLLDGELGKPKTPAEAEFVGGLGSIDMLIGGPPCQGNSDLNNHTRRADPRNALFLSMARFAELVRPRYVLIENVPGVLHDRARVVQRTVEALLHFGYDVTLRPIQAERLGVAQRRRRLFVIASLDGLPADSEWSSLEVPDERPMAWAIGDLVDAETNASPYESPARHYPVNRARIQFLFDNDLYDLPNELRPDCHRLKRHSYNGVYGRMYWDRPAPTITTGFGSTGQGRFVHPLRPRTLTPHEAARVQFIPDFFEFPSVRRGALQEMIGNAVPPKLSYAMTLPLLALSERAHIDRAIA